MSSPDLGDDISSRFDLDQVPYTARFSRLFVRRGDHGLDVYRAAYERSLADSLTVVGLRLLDSKGSVVDVESVGPAGIVFRGGARLIVDDQDTVYVGDLPAGWTVLASLPLPDVSNRASAGQWPKQLLLLPDDARTTPTGVLLPTGGSVGIGATAAPCRTFREASAAVDGELASWLAACPIVADRWREITRFCWWVLGVNTLRLDAPPGLARAVVPSKIGYVGLWQWDAYFMAIGLRHGDPELAAEQLRIAFAYPSASGQLPDVVHEGGVLASSDDLPPGDIENLRKLASPSLANQRVPLTKPPLAPLALALLAEVAGEEIIDESLETVLAAQRWWYRDSAPWGEPAYLHPYSSGLDDSPIFDDDAILVSPDLSAYLISSDRLLAGWLRARGRDGEAGACQVRADQATARLLEKWDRQRGFFYAVGEHGRVITETVVSLMPLLVEGLPAEQVDAMVAAVADPERFATPVPVPTVAYRDPKFSPTRMWRGPVWVNTAWLVARGLRVQGRGDLADAVETALLDLVSQHGPNEYFRPDTGVKPPRATTVFGWSAALTVDLAVRHSAR